MVFHNNSYRRRITISYDMKSFKFFFTIKLYFCIELSTFGSSSSVIPL